MFSQRSQLRALLLLSFICPRRQRSPLFQINHPLLRQPCGQFLQTPDTSSALCAARHSPWDQRQSQPISCRPWQLGIFVPCCMHRLVRDSPRDGIESCLRAVVFWHSKQSWQISHSSKVRSSDFKRAEFWNIYGGLIQNFGFVQCRYHRMQYQECIHAKNPQVNSHIWKVDRLYMVKIPILFICIQLQGWLQHLTVWKQ